MRTYWRKKITYHFNHFRHWHHYIHFYEIVIGTKRIVSALPKASNKSQRVFSCSMSLFIRPKSDHCPLLWVTHWLTDSCNMTWKYLLWWPWVRCVLGNVFNKWPNNDFLCLSWLEMLLYQCISHPILRHIAAFHEIPATRSFSIFGTGRVRYLKKVRDESATRIPSGPV